MSFLIWSAQRTLEILLMAVRGSRWAPPDDDIWHSLPESRGMTTKSKKTYARSAPTTAELLARITLTNGSPLPTALQVSVLLEFLSLTHFLRGGLLAYAYNLQEMVAGNYTSPRNVMAAYRAAYSDAFGEGEEGDEAELALLLSFFDDVLGGNPEADLGGFSFGDTLAEYCEKILNENRARPVLLKVEIARVDKEGMHRSIADQIRKAVKDCVTDLNKPAVKQSSSLPDQQELPYAEPEPPAPKFRAPARHRDWTGQWIAYKSDSQKLVIGTVLSDIDGRIWFTDEQGKEWGGDAGVDKGRCTAVAPVAGARVALGGKPDFEFVLDRLQGREVKRAHKKAARPGVLPGEPVFDMVGPRGRAGDELFDAHLNLFKGYEPGEPPFFQLRALAAADGKRVLGTSPPFFELEGIQQLWIHFKNYTVEIRHASAV
jgi:hypothetical protein